MAILDFDKSVWFEALQETLGEVPHALILEGTWWRETACRERLKTLRDVRELSFPDMFVGNFNGARVAYCCAYGAARAVEPAHVFAQLGTPLLIQIGTCGVMAEGISAGTVAVPQAGSARDGVSQHYGASDTVGFSKTWGERAKSLLNEAGVSARATAHLTWPSLFAQSDAMCRGWGDDGLETVDMEATVVAAVAERFGRDCVALLVAWDMLTEGRTFLDPLSDDLQSAFSAANAATFDVALKLAVEIAEKAGT